MPDYTILVIDYEPSSIEKLKLMLRKQEYRVAVASDGLGGIEAFHQIEPVLVLIEQLLPRKTGLETCRELKKTPSGARTPIVIMGSRYGGRKMRNRAIDIYEANEFITKPVNEDDLLAVIEKLDIPRPSQQASIPPIEAAPVAAPSTEASRPTTPPDKSVESEIADRLDSLFADSSLERT